jgi:hypothetical protein
MAAGVEFHIHFFISSAAGAAQGLTALVVMCSVAARFFTPQIGGVGAVPIVAGSLTPFRFDHDEHFNQTTHLQYQSKKSWPWIGFKWRYDSGLVAGPVPCEGGNCAGAQVPGFVDVSGLSPDQQFQAGPSCAGVFATPPSPSNPTATPIIASGLCPSSQYTSRFLKIPAPGTENDDHYPPRVAARNLFDLAVGDDNLFRGDRYKWSLGLTAINIGNKEAVYNFLSTFSGTHCVTPRALSAEVGFHF